MNRSFYLIALLALAAGCNNVRYKKAKSGLEYKIFDGDGKKKISYGNTVKFKAMGYYQDSILSTPFDTVAQFVEIDSAKLPKDYVTIFEEATSGDSIVTRILVDTAMKYGQVPPFAKKGNFLGFRMKVIDVISDPKEAEAQKQASFVEMKKMDSLAKEKQMMTDDKILQDTIAKEGVTTVKAPKGTYVQIKSPGTGDDIDSGKAVTVLYTGKTLDGKVFDKSYDSAGNPTKPFTFIVGQRGAIAGWDDGIRMLKKGSEARFFIPSSLGYGSRGAGADIKPNSPLIFDVKIVDVVPGDEYRKQMEVQRKAMQDLMKMQHPNGQAMPGQQRQPQVNP